jgi:hypothetical protein
MDIHMNGAAIEFESVVEGDVIRIPEVYRETAARARPPVSVTLWINTPSAAREPAREKPGGNNLLSLYGAFKDAPIPDKAELRRRFHEESAR